MLRPSWSLNAEHRHVIRDVVKTTVEFMIVKNVFDVSRRVLDYRTADSQVETFITCPQCMIL